MSILLLLTLLRAYLYQFDEQINNFCRVFAGVAKDSKKNVRFFLSSCVQFLRICERKDVERNFGEVRKQNVGATAGQKFPDSLAPLGPIQFQQGIFGSKCR